MRKPEETPVSYTEFPRFCPAKSCEWHSTDDTVPPPGVINSASHGRERVEDVLGACCGAVSASIGGQPASPARMGAAHRVLTQVSGRVPGGACGVSALPDGQQLY